MTYTSGQWKAGACLLFLNTTKLTSIVDLAAVAANVDPSVQEGLKKAWTDLVMAADSTSNLENVHVMDSIESAVRFAQSREDKTISVLACGSLHLVGGVTEVSGI